MHDTETVLKRIAELGLVEPNRLAAVVPGSDCPLPDALLRLADKNLLTSFQCKTISKGLLARLRIGDYLILDRLGAGGMGEVFRARHCRMGRLAALKVLPDRFAADDGAVQRFVREIQTVAKLSHPNVVAAIDAGEANGSVYLAMEYVPGNDLATLVKSKGPMSMDDAVACVIHAARGLAFAHNSNVIHRDVKPSNLMLAENGDVKILDLGLARLVSPEDSTATDLTTTGTVMGTVDYMAPEQAENSKDADERSDIYSLGCTLYFLATGRPAYSGETVVQKILAHRSHAIPRIPGASDAINDVFSSMVAKAPRNRIASMEQVEQALMCGMRDDGQSTELIATQEPGSPVFRASISRTDASVRLESGEIIQGAGSRRPRKSTSAPAFWMTSAIAFVIAVAGFAYFLTRGHEENASRDAGTRSDGSSDPEHDSVGLRFDGIDDYVSIPTLHIKKSDSFTVEAILSDHNPPPPGGNSRQVLIYIASEDGFVLVEYSAGGFWKAGFWPQTGKVGGAATERSKNRLERVHIALTWDGEVTQLFVNGHRSQALIRAPGQRSVPKGLSIGCSMSDAGRKDFFDGTLHAVRVSRGVRYKSPFAVPRSLKKDPASLAVYELRAGGGSVLRDSSGHGHNGTIHGAKWVPPTSVDRSVAEYVLGRGGQVWVESPTERTPHFDRLYYSKGRSRALISDLRELPDGNIVLRYVAMRAGDEDISRIVKCQSIRAIGIGRHAGKGADEVSPTAMKLLLRSLPRLTHLFVEGTRFSDNLAPDLARLKYLTHLDLSETLASDKLLDTVASLLNLEMLGLVGARASEAAIMRLAALTKLRSLNLTKTGVRADVIKRLGKALRACQISH